MTEYEKFKRNRDAKRQREHQLSKADGLTSPDSEYQKFLIGRANKKNLAQKKEQQRSFLESDKNIGFLETLAPGGATPSDWNESRKRKKQYQNEVDEAAAQVAAYEQFLEEKRFQDKVKNMSADDIDSLLADYDSKIKSIKDDGGLFNAVMPGGIKPSEYSSNRDKINALEAERGKYRAIRDEKKSREMTDNLPEDVIKLLDEYNSLGTANEGIDLSNMFVDASQKSHAQINSQKLGLQKRQLEIGEELKKQGYDNYEELAEYRKYITDKQDTQEFETEMAEFTKEHPVISSVGNIGLMPARTIVGAMGNMSAMDNKSDLSVNPYSPYYGLTRGNRAKKETIENSFEDGKLSAKAKRFLYSTAESGVESLLAASMGPAGGVLLGMGAMNETVIDTLEKGGTAEQALISGVAAGAFETIFETVSIGQFNAFKEVSATTFKDAMLNVVKGTAVNFSEEAATEIANIAFDYWYNGGQSDYYETVAYLIKKGYSEEEAKSIANRQMAWQVTEAGLGGALMGAAFGGVGSASSVAAYNSAMLDEGRRIAQEGTVENELAAASELGVNKEDPIYKFVKEAEAYQRQKTDNDTFEGAKKQFRSIGRLSEGLDRIASDKMRDTSLKSIQDRLTALGENGDVEGVARVIHKISENIGATDSDSMSKLTRAERKILANNPSAQRVLSEITGSKYFKSDGWNVTRAQAIDKVINSRKSPDIEAYRSDNVPEKAAESKVQEVKEETPYGFDKYENAVKEKIINEGQNKERFDSDFELFKTYGEMGRDFEQVKDNTNVSEDFTEAQKEAAYKLGKEKAEAKKITVIKEVKSISSDGEVIVADVNGGEFRMSEANTDETTRSLVNNAAKYDVQTANVFIRGYNRSATVTSYARAFKVFYSAGAAKSDTSFADVMKANGELTRYMADNDVAEKAFKLGREERLKADKSMIQKKQTGKKPSKGEYKSRAVAVGEEAVDEFYTALSKKLGIDIDRVQSIRNSEGMTANAQYSPSKNKMTVSATADNEWQGSTHELVHGAFAYNTEKMKAVKKAVIDWFISQHGETEFENALEKYKMSYEGLTRAELEEEFTADAIGGMFSTEEGVQDFLNWLQNESGYNQAEKKTILQRITEWLNDIIEAIRDVMNSGELNGAGKYFAKEQCDELEKIRKQFLEVLDGYGENYRKGGVVEGEVRNSIVDSFFDDKGNEYENAVLLDTDFFDGLSPYNWSRKLRSYVIERSSKKPFILPVIDENGVIQQLQFAKPSDRVTKNGKSNHKVLDELVYSKDNISKLAVVHIDEIISISEEKNPYYTNEHNHQWLDENGWLHRNAYVINSKNGDVFNLTVDIAKSRDGRHILFATKGKIKKVGNVQLNSLKIKGSGLNSNYTKSLSHNNLNVKNSITVNIDKSAELSKLEAEKKKYDDEVFSLRRDFDKLKRTDEYERLETAVIEARGDDEAFNAAIDEYNKWLKESGMGEINRKLTEAKAKQSELYKEITRMQNDLHKDFMKSIESFDDETVAKYVNKAVRKFKTTSRFNLAGYITTTGSLLDFSGGQGYRVQDHTEVKDILDLPDYAEYSDGMIAFMNMGNIRLQSYGIDISKMPNSKQISVLRRFFNSLNGEVTVDFSLPDGHTDGSIEYPENTKADRILNDIKKYFETGVVPELSTVERFRYSLPLAVLYDLNASNIEKVTELGRVAAQLTAHINYIGSSQTKRVLSELNVQAAARELKKEYSSKADIHKLTAELLSLYQKFENGRVSQDVVKVHIDNIVDMVINDSVYMKPDISDAAKEILHEIRSGKIKLSDTQKTQAAYHFGSYNEFRKRVMGSVVLSEEGTPLDERWQELSEMYPGRFDSETVDTNQPYALFETIKELRNTYEDESGLDIDSVKAQLSADICANYINIPTIAQYSNEFSVKEQELIQSLRDEKKAYKQIYSESYKRAKARFDGQLLNIKADQAEEILRAKARMNQRVENIADTRIREKKRNRLIKTVKRLDRLLRNPDRAAPSAGTNKYGQEYVHLTNIPEDLKRTVIDFCSVFIDNDAGVFTGNIRDGVIVLDKKIHEMQKIYSGLKESKSYMRTVVNEDMEKKILKVAEIMGQRRLAQLSASELDTVNEIADHLITVINNEVEMWVNGKKTKVNNIGKQTLNNLNSKGMKGYREVMKGIDKLGVMNLKPIYFFEKVGGPLEELWKDILSGQDRYVRNMQYAQQRFSEISEKYNLDKWEEDEPLNLKTSQGHEISLTRGQALLVWATWKREGIAGKESKHLFEGGIVFPDAVESASDKGKNKLPAVLRKVYEDGSAHRIRVEDMLKIDEWLTKKQKAYADELVSFLSNDVGGWGNEISMQLYGINKFNEKYYIPFNSAGNYLYKGMGDEGTKLLKSEGFTKETKWGANNPLVVDDFTEVVVKHIERMSMYNSMVIPLDNFSRVWNYQERADADSNDSQQNVKAAFKTAWGEEYKKYVDNLLRDINGGVMSDSREFGDKWISKFKKAAVMGSASVIIQQPSAIARALSEVDAKYFAETTFSKRKTAYEEAMRYAPVAVLKEIGGFDTVGGQSMTDWMLKKKYKGKDKLLALLKDSQYRDDVISWGPAWADRVTWAHIWLACKKEVQQEKGLRGEALLEATGERFTEVINKTQVYDSVLSRSDAMRSKNTLMKMQTAFMAEPTTQFNMWGSAMRDWKKSDKENRKKAAKKVSSLVAAQILNSALVSIIYAARDDDEEKTQWEKYVASVVGNFLDSMNPLSLIPFVKDIISLAQGYSVERTDMSVFSNVVDALSDLGNENMTSWEKAFGLAGSVTDVFGIPFKNLVRDAKATVNTVQSLSGGKETTSGGMIAAIRDELFPILKNLGVISYKKGDLLFDAFVNENAGMYAEYASRYKDGKAVKSALTTQIKERYLEGDINEDKATELLKKLGYGANDAYYKIREWNTPDEDSEESEEDKDDSYMTLDGMKNIEVDAEGGVSYTFLNDAIASGDTAAIKSEIADLIKRGAEEENIKRSVTSKWGKAYRESTSSTERKKIEQMIAATGLWTSGEVFAMTKRWRESKTE